MEHHTTPNPDNVGRPNRRSAILKPSDLLTLAENGVFPVGPVALDTETSGLHVDDGARVAVVAIAFSPSCDFQEYLEGQGAYHENDDKFTYGVEVVDDSINLPVVSFAFPFDQGTEGTGKPEDTGQGTLFGENPNLDIDEWQALLTWLELVGENQGPYLVMHHAKFDMHMMNAGVRRWPGQGIDLQNWLVWDTQNVAHLAWPQHKTTGLKPTSRILWGVAETNESELVQTYLRKTKLPSGRWDLVPWEIIAPYAQQDARLTLRLHHRQLNELINGTLMPWIENDFNTKIGLIQRRLATTQMLYRMELRGLPFDGPTALGAADLIDQKVEELEQKLPFQPTTLPMAKHYWFGQGNKGGVDGLGLTPYAYTQNGSPQVNAQVVEQMAENGVPYAAEWRDLQKLQTVGSRWYRGWGSMTGPDGRLRASVRQNGTVSGRFSVQRVQLQAIPHDYRLTGEALEGIPTPRALINRGIPKGYELWELDLAQAELRVAALYANCARMLELINAGEDLHGDAATQLFGVTADSPEWGRLRNVAKRANFSLIFGVGAEKLRGDIEAQTGVVLSYEETKKLVYDWNGLYPEYRQAIDMHMNIVEKRQAEGLGWVELWNKERRWFQQEEEAHKAFNQRVQPALAQFGIDWWLEVSKLFDDPEGMVMTVHDSIVLLLKSDTAETSALTAKAIGLDLWDDVFAGVPGEIDMKRWE
jgi:DNA polymerase I-like protein with 3'-5' exonuclease and polymerase domains